MLRELAIRDFAIIDDLRIEFGKGLTILSGETGAGKSLVINAVALLLGARADIGLIRSGAEAAEVEAAFDIQPGSPCAERMAESGFDRGEGLLVRRVISRNERHRTYLNGRLATAGQLGALTEGLASIAGQHAHQRLLRDELHLLTLDQYAGLMKPRQALAARYRQILPLIRRLEELQRLRLDQHAQCERLGLLQREIAEAGIAPGEDEVLAQERQRLRHAASLYGRVNESLDQLYGGTGAVLERLSSVRLGLEKASQLDGALQAPTARLAEAAFAVEDAAAELRRYLGALQLDEGRLERIETRLDLLAKLKRKYGGSLEAVLERLAHASADLAQLEQLDADLGTTQQALEALHAQLENSAEALSASRHRAAEELARRVERELAGLNMAGTRFQMSVEPLAADGQGSSPYLLSQGRRILETGFDRGRFLIAPNPGEPLKPLSAIASGGELSRVVLALKAILAESEALATIVFDEVDAGIGGQTAEAVGAKLAELARRQQVLCITHLPQIAKFADHHLLIVKRIHQGRTCTHIAPLDAPQRVAELARLLGGATITQRTLDHAAEMINQKEHLVQRPQQPPGPATRSGASRRRTCPSTNSDA